MLVAQTQAPDASIFATKMSLLLALLVMVVVPKSAAPLTYPVRIAEPSARALTRVPCASSLLLPSAACAAQTNEPVASTLAMKTVSAFTPLSEIEPVAVAKVAVGVM